MKKEFSKTFDLTVQRPQVLLIGNGIARSASNNPSWAQLIEKMADTPKQVNDLPQGLPYSLRATVCAPTEDKPRRERYRQLLKNIIMRKMKISNAFSTFRLMRC